MNQTISDFSNERDKVVGQLKEAQVTYNGAAKDMAAAAPSGSSSMLILCPIFNLRACSQATIITLSHCTFIHYFLLPYLLD